MWESIKNIYFLTQDGSSPLMNACIMGHKEIVQDLILRGADISFKDNVLLCVVCSSGVTTIVLLSQCGATAFDKMKTEEMKKMYTAAVEVLYLYTAGHKVVFFI